MEDHPDVEGRPELTVEKATLFMVKDRGLRLLKGEFPVCVCEREGGNREGALSKG